MYKPNFVNSSFLDKLQDKFIGTNNVKHKDFLNQLELQKFQADLNYQIQKQAQQDNYSLMKDVNINKYEWNKQGMIQSGINPLAASSSLNSISGAPNINAPNMNLGTYEQNSSLGYLGNMFVGVIDELNPVNMIKEIKGLIKNLASNFIR